MRREPEPALVPREERSSPAPRGDPTGGFAGVSPTPFALFSFACAVFSPCGFWIVHF